MMAPLLASLSLMACASSVTSFTPIFQDDIARSARLMQDGGRVPEYGESRNVRNRRLFWLREARATIANEPTDHKTATNEPVTRRFTIDVSGLCRPSLSLSSSYCSSGPTRCLRRPKQINLHRLLLHKLCTKRYPYQGITSRLCNLMLASLHRCHWLLYLSNGRLALPPSTRLRLSLGLMAFGIVGIIASDYLEKKMPPEAQK